MVSEIFLLKMRGNSEPAASPCMIRDFCWENGSDEFARGLANVCKGLFFLSGVFYSFLLNRFRVFCLIEV